MKFIILVFSLFLFSFSLHAQIITTIAGSGIGGVGGDGGHATDAQFSELTGVTADKWGNIYVADWGANVVRKIDTNGIITRFAGGGAGGDGGLATAAALGLYLVPGLAADTAGNIYISDNSAVRMVNTSGIITTVAGNGTYGHSGDGGPATAAEISAPTGICLDKVGNLYISDEQASNIRMVNTSGIISTIAGTTIGFSGDGGPATNAQLKLPDGISVDDSGNIYFVDAINDRLRKIDKSGVINTIAGDPSSSTGFYNGCPAVGVVFGAPEGLAIDRYGNVYVSDDYSEVVYKITKEGLAYIVAGNGTEGFSGDNGPATAARLARPSMICFDNAGNLLIADRANWRLRKVWYATSGAPVVKATAAHLSVFPNPAVHGAFTCNITANTNEEAKIVITNVLGEKVKEINATTNKATEIKLQAPPGIYFLSALTKDEKFVTKLVVE